MSWFRDSYRHSLAARRISLLSVKSRLIDLKRHSTLDFTGVPTSFQVDAAYKNLVEARNDLRNFDALDADAQDAANRAERKALIRGIDPKEAIDIADRVYEQKKLENYSNKDLFRAKDIHSDAWHDFDDARDQRKNAKEQLDNELLSSQEVYPTEKNLQYIDRDSFAVRRHPSDTEVINDVHKVGVMLGRAPSRKEYNELGKYHSDTAIAHTGMSRDWDNALYKADLVDLYHPTEYHQILEDEGIRRLPFAACRNKENIDKV